MLNPVSSLGKVCKERLVTTLRFVVSSIVWMTLSLCLKRICSITSARMKPNFWKCQTEWGQRGWGWGSERERDREKKKRETLRSTEKQTSSHNKPKIKTTTTTTRTATHLIGAADKFEDVHLGMRLSVVCEKGVEVWDWWQGAVLIAHTVQIPVQKQPHTQSCCFKQTIHSSQIFSTVKISLKH